MCGFAGYAGWPAGKRVAKDVLSRMGAVMQARGPDDAGTWVDEQAEIGLSHQRLAVMDLSPLGHQPMPSLSGRFVIVFNGEIYNYRDLRQELQARGVPFRGGSDTEVLLAAVERWGLVDTLPRLNGMFAFALWDRQERILHLVRDRMGEKPLYYGMFGQILLFGSSLDALRAHPKFSAEIDREALASFMRLSYVPEPHTIYDRVYKLPPGCLFSFRAGQAMSSGPIPYWSLSEVVERSVVSRARGTHEGRWIEETDALLKMAVRDRMVADVPLGAFLSGGIDSSLIVALMQAQSPRPVKTFTIGFGELEFNEAEHAAAISRHLGTDHTELTVAPEDALAAVEVMASLYDEPFADVSQLPTLLLARLVRRSVTVALSGDGGDELFGGYHRHISANHFMPYVFRLPHMMRTGLARVLSGSSRAVLRVEQSFLARIPEVPPHMGEKLAKLGEAITTQGPIEFYRTVASRYRQPLALVRTDTEREWLPDMPNSVSHLMDPAEVLMYLDARRYLPDDVLVKVDRATMGVSLEARVPFLDHRVVEHAWSVPIGLKIKGLQGKWLLRQILARYIPPALFERPKTGFTVPIGAWLRGPLQEWADSLLSISSLNADSLLRAGAVRRLWDDHQARRGDHQDVLWNVLMYRMWSHARAPLSGRFGYSISGTAAG